MSNSLAEAYLLIVRESNVPIIGEAVPVPFTGQIELDAWTWDIKNDKQLVRARRQERTDDDARTKKKEAREAKQKGKEAAKASSDAKIKTPSIKPEDLIKRVADIQKSGRSQKDRDEEVKKLIKRAVVEYKEIADQASEASKDEDDPHRDEQDDDKKMKFTFEKGTDLATTPLLYALARGDLIPKAILTLFHRAKGAPVTLVITMSDIRITNYRVSCEAEAAMSDVKETWEATYKSIDWMYQNRPAASGPNGLTQGTARVFAMKSKFSANSPI
jgi:type VI protein secretion system component Hcp